MRTYAVILLVGVLALLLSCGQPSQPDSSPQTNVPAQVITEGGESQSAVQPSVAAQPPVAVQPSVAAAIPPPDPGDLLLEEKIIRYNTIVWATLASTTSEVVLASDIYRGTVDDRYRVVVKFNFTVHEYLKGSGPTNITAIWLGATTYKTRAEAETERARVVQRRDTQWDDERAIVFLTGNHGGNMEAFGTVLTELFQRDDHFYFSSEARYYDDDGYSLHSPSRVLWFPEQRPRLLADGLYMMTLPPDPELITPAKIKQDVAEVNAEIIRNDSEEYRECLVKKYEHMRNRRNWPIERGMEYTHWNLTPAIESGQPTGIEVVQAGFLDEYPDPVPTQLEAKDSALFSLSTGPSNNPAIFDEAEIISTTRPLPAGTYSFDLRQDWPVFSLCDYVVTDTFTVIATPPIRTTHEFFFDPVTVGSAVAADSSNGVLKPASFTGADGESATIDRIAWEPPSTGSEQAGAVKIEVSPHTALGGHTLDFIEVDGSVSLSLNPNDAMKDTSAGTLTWSVPDQPWHDGDLLMVRVRRSPLTPQPTGLLRE